MAALTGESTAVTDGAALLILWRLAGAVTVDPVVCMAHRLQVRSISMALRATERRIDSIVANKTISHVREQAGRHLVRPLNSVMAGQAIAARCQVRRMDICRTSKVRFRLDSLRDCRTYIVEPGVQRVVEFRDRSLARNLDLPRILVTSRTYCFIRQEIVLRLDTLQRRRMTHSACKLLL